jgi:hypothetical protein
MVNRIYSVTQRLREITQPMSFKIFQS